MTKHKTDILNRSKELFERFGYQKTTLTDIAKSVGKVKTAIYYYFSGKEEIFAELVELESVEFYSQLTSTVEKEKTCTAKLEKYVEVRIELMQKLSKRYHFLKQEFFELLPIIEKHRKAEYVLEVDFVENILLEGIEKGEFDSNSPLFSATTLVNSLKGLEIQMFVTDQFIVKGMNINDFRNFILYGVIQNKK